MNETATTMSDLPEDEQQFAYIIFEVIKDKYAKYEKEYQTGKDSRRVPLADIKFKSQDFFDYTIMMPGIPIVKGKNPCQNWKTTAEHMLDRLYKKGELEVYSECPKVYMLSKEGVLYRHLTE